MAVWLSDTVRFFPPLSRFALWCSQSKLTRLQLPSGSSNQDARVLILSRDGLENCFWHNDTWAYGGIPWEGPGITADEIVDIVRISLSTAHARHSSRTRERTRAGSIATLDELSFQVKPAGW